MTVNEIIKLLDKEENKYGGATGRERVLNLEVNGEFLGSIKSATLDGWGDGLITDVTLELQCEKGIRAKAIDEFARQLKESLNQEFPSNYESTRPYFSLENARLIVDDVAEQLKAGGIDG